MLWNFSNGESFFWDTRYRSKKKPEKHAMSVQTVLLYLPERLTLPSSGYIKKFEKILEITVFCLLYFLIKSSRDRWYDTIRYNNTRPGHILAYM